MTKLHLRCKIEFKVIMTVRPILQLFPLTGTSSAAQLGHNSIERNTAAITESSMENIKDLVKLRV